MCNQRRWEYAKFSNRDRIAGHRRRKKNPFKSDANFHDKEEINFFLYVFGQKFHFAHSILRCDNYLDDVSTFK